MTNLRPRPDADDLTLSEEDRRELVDWAARECEDFAAQAVARACGQAIAVAHMGGHARNVERYTRKALSGAALVAELEWQRASIPARLREYVFGGWRVRAADLPDCADDVEVENRQAERRRVRERESVIGAFRR